MMLRPLAVCFAALCVFDACSGGSGSGTPSAPSTASHNANPPLLYSLGSATTASTSATTPPAGTLGLQSLDLTFTYAGQANAVLVYEVGYTGKFTIASSCTTGPTVAERTRFAATPTASATATSVATPTAKPSATATATATATAKPSATATASASAAATATATPTAKPSATASASPTAAPTATATATASGPAAATATFSGSTSGTGPGSVMTVTAGSVGGTCQFTVTDSSNNTSVLFVGNTLTTGSVS